MSSPIAPRLRNLAVTSRTGPARNEGRPAGGFGQRGDPAASRCRCLVDRDTVKLGGGGGGGTLNTSCFCRYKTKAMSIENLQVEGVSIEKCEIMMSLKNRHKPYFRGLFKFRRWCHHIFIAVTVVTVMQLLTPDSCWRSGGTMQVQYVNKATASYRLAGLFAPT